MRKSTRIVTLILAHAGLLAALAYLILLVISMFVPSVGEYARNNFFLFDYGYLIIPILCMISGILIQVSATRPRKARSDKKTIMEE
ncbi:MAG: hypothetical protein IJJ86_01765 [Clostridia bacterium]|nr:hypothetical protein [Clostridia bacterium]